jgi:hypothetical protein
MGKIIVPYEWPADPEHLRSFNKSRRLPLAAGLPGLKRMRYSFEILSPAGPAS